MNDQLLTDGLNNLASNTKNCKVSTKNNILQAVIHDHDQLDIIKHSPITTDAIRTLTFVCGICSLFMIIEFIGGLMSNSVAIMADAAHLLSDLIGFLISIYALYIADKAPNANFTLGYHRAEIVSAVASIFLIWILNTILLVESFARLIYSNRMIKGGLMLITSSIGLVFNGIMAYVLHSKVRGAHRHNNYHCNKQDSRGQGTENAFRSVVKKDSHSTPRHANVNECNDVNAINQSQNLQLKNSNIISEEVIVDKPSTYAVFKLKKNDSRVQFTEMNQIHFIDRNKDNADVDNNQHLITNIEQKHQYQYQSPDQLQEIQKRESIMLNGNLRSDFDMIDNNNSNLNKRKSEIITLENAKTRYHNFDFFSPQISKQRKSIIINLTVSIVTRDFSKFAKLGAFIGLKKKDKESNSSIFSDENEEESFYTISVNSSSKDVNQSLGISPNKLHDSLRQSHHNSNANSNPNGNVNINSQPSFIHIIGDITQSIGVIIASALIYFFPSYQIIDPLTTILFSIVVIITTVPIIKQCVFVIMEGNGNSDVFSTIKNELINTSGVISVNCLHLYYLSLDKAVLCGHIKAIKTVNECELLKRINEELSKYKIYHCTIEISQEDSLTCSNMMDIY